jgi:hypothetical protein
MRGHDGVKLGWRDDAAVQLALRHRLEVSDAHGLCNQK